VSTTVLVLAGLFVMYYFNQTPSSKKQGHKEHEAAWTATSRQGQRSHDRWPCWPATTEWQCTRDASSIQR